MLNRVLNTPLEAICYMFLILSQYTIYKDEPGLQQADNVTELARKGNKTIKTTLKNEVFHELLQ